MAHLESLSSNHSHGLLVASRRTVNARPFHHVRGRGRIHIMAVQGRQQQQQSYRSAGPDSPAPDYSALDSHVLNRVVMDLFRRKMVAAIGQDSKHEG
jgi:hypothetical protein